MKYPKSKCPYYKRLCEANTTTNCNHCAVEEKKSRRGEMHNKHYKASGVVYQPHLQTLNNLKNLKITLVLHKDSSIRRRRITNTMYNCWNRVQRLGLLVTEYKDFTKRETVETVVLRTDRRRHTFPSGCSWFRREPGGSGEEEEQEKKRWDKTGLVECQKQPAL